MRITKNLIALTLAVAMVFGLMATALAFMLNGDYDEDYLPYPDDGNGYVTVPDDENELYYPEDDEYFYGDEYEDYYVDFAPAYMGIMPFGYPIPQNIRVNPVAVGSDPTRSPPHHQVQWDGAAGSIGYTIYVFASATDTSTPLRTHPVATTQLNIPSFGTRDPMPFAPLPHGDYFIRVRAHFPTGDSDLSSATGALQFSRRVATAQQNQVITEHASVEPGAGFIIIDIQNAAGHMAFPGAATIFPGAIRIPFDNQAAGVNNYGNPTYYHQMNIDFGQRVQHELRAHPNYRGPNTLIFLH